MPGTLEKKRYARAAALPVAEELQSRLKLACHRLAIAGSLRRGREFVGDIELLFVPKLCDRPDGLFDRRVVSVPDELCEEMLFGGVLAKRPNVNGAFTWGVSNKLAIHVPSGIPVDLFSTTEENWWVSLVIRTGSKETNLTLAMSARDRGRQLLAYGPGVKVLATGEIIPARSEREVFELCGVPWLEPGER